MIKYLQSRFVLIGLFLILISSANFSDAQELIRPAPDMPFYKLDVVSQGNDTFGRPKVTIDYQRTKTGTGLAMLAGRTSDGPLVLSGFGFLHDASGKLELSDLFSGTSLSAELYVVITGSFAEEYSFKCLASNVVRVGNPSGSPTFAREWNSNETVAYQKDLVGRKPPASLPKGLQLVQATTKLVPGMPIQVGRFGEWVDAEALTSDANVTVKILGVAGLRMVTRDGWIAIDPSVVQRGVSSPDSFQPSARVIPGTTEILPEGYVITTPSMNILPGTPVKAMWHERLMDATILSVDGKKLKTHYDSQPAAFDTNLDYRLVAISEQTIEELAKPGAEENFQKRLGNNSDGLPGASLIGGGNANLGFPEMELMLRSYPIDIPIPKEAELLPLEISIPRGTKLAACWGRRWNYVTVLNDSDEDTLQIHWDEHASGFDELIHRSELIIRKTDLKKLRNKENAIASRTWTDATGKFKVEAKLASRTATHVTLIKGDGKEVKLPIDKLSSTDKAWLKKNP